MEITKFPVLCVVALCCWGCGASAVCGRSNAGDCDQRPQSYRRTAGSADPASEDRMGRVEPIEAAPAQTELEGPNSPAERETPIEPTPEATAPPRIPGSNVQMGSLTSDGIALTDVECRVDGDFGLLGSVLLASGLSSRSARIGRCLRGEASVEIVWNQSGGRVRSVQTPEADRRLSRCLSRAIVGGVATINSVCAGTLSMAP